jgi:hypothetical protein
MSSKNYLDLTEFSIQRKARTQLEQAKFGVQGLASKASTEGKKDKLTKYAMLISLLNDADTLLTELINTPT